MKKQDMDVIKSSKIIWGFLIENEDVILSQCFNILGTLHEAEDALSEIRLHLFDLLSHKTDYLKEIQNHTAWLKQISKNYCIDYIRKQRHITNWGETDPERPNDNNSVFHSIHIERLINELNAILNSLPQPQGDALFDRIVDGRSYISIARSQNITEANARKRVQLARQSIRNSLNPELNDSQPIS